MNELTEAPISASTKVKSTNGFEYILTMREGLTEELFSNLMKLITEKEKVLLAKGWTPLSQQQSKYPAKVIDYVEGRVCPKDGGKLIKPPEGTNRPIKCENSKYDWKTKTSSGCDFLEWPKSGYEKDMENNEGEAPEYVTRSGGVND